jgi:hypothetical protein
MQMSLFRAAAKTTTTTRRSMTKTSRWPELPRWLLLLQQLVGVVAHVVTHDRGSPPAAMRAVHRARYTTPSATAWRSAGRSRSSQSSSSSSKSSSHTMMAHLPDSRKASSKLPPIAHEAVYGHSDSSTDKRRKQLHVMYGSTWDITSRCIVKMLHQAMVVVVPMLRAAPPPQVDGDVDQVQRL